MSTGGTGWLGTVAQLKWSIHSRDTCDKVSALSRMTPRRDSRKLHSHMCLRTAAIAEYDAVDFAALPNADAFNFT